MTTTPQRVIAEATQTAELAAERFLLASREFMGEVRPPLDEVQRALLEIACLEVLSAELRMKRHRILDSLYPRDKR